MKSRVHSWIDTAINAKAPVGEASRSWWATGLTREQFDQQVKDEQARLNRSRFGRLAIPAGTKGDD